MTNGDLEARLFRPVNLVPVVGYFTMVDTALRYKGETERIRFGSIASEQNPAMRDINCALVSNLLLLYHFAVGVVGAYYTHLPERISTFMERLF